MITFFNMVSITLAVPEKVKKRMERFSEVNWSGFVRKVIIQKTEELTWKEELLKELKGEEELRDWAVKLQRASRQGRLEALKKKGLVT